ncbi:unnamed protein product, partial [Symbiodinium natans]
MSQPLLMMQRSTNPGKSPAVTGSEGQKYPLADAGRTHVGFVSGFTQKWAHDSFVVAVAAHREDSIDFAWIRKVRVGQEVQQTEHVSVTDPVWNEKFEFFIQGTEVIIFSIWDYDLTGGE